MSQQLEMKKSNFLVLEKAFQSVSAVCSAACCHRAGVEQALSEVNDAEGAGHAGRCRPKEQRKAEFTEMRSGSRTPLTLAPHPRPCIYNL